MQVLDHQQIEQKIERLAIEILEHHLDAPELFFLGINDNGMAFARRLLDKIREHTAQTLHLHQLCLSPANPLSNPVNLDLPLENLRGKTVIVVDDVANTGRTLFYAMQPLYNTLPKIVEVCVLVDRRHKGFPIWVKFVGLSLSTTLQDNIRVSLKSGQEMVILE